MRSAPLLLPFLLLAGACGPSTGKPAAAPAAAPVAAPAPTPEGTSIDRGAFVISLGGQPAGRETFDIRRLPSGDHEIETHDRLAQGGIELVQDGTLRTDEAWRPLSASFTGKAGGRDVTLTVRKTDAGLLEATTVVNGREDTARASRPSDLFIANNTIAHFTPLCALPAAEAGEKIAWPGFAITYAPARPLAVAPGRDVVVREIDFAGSLRLQLACEGPRAVGAAEPMTAFLAVREGDDALAAALARKPREKPPTPDTLVELPRRVKAPAGAGVGDAVLDCTLLLPRAYAEVSKRPPARSATPPLPAVVFITGSGPQDRDEDSPGPGGLKLAIFKVVAIALGEAGIASLRCDDLGTGKSTGDFAAGTRQSFTALTRAQVEALRAEPAIDPRRIGLVGHSEGGLVAPLVAAEDPRLRALVLMAGPGRALDVIVVEQVEAALRASGASEDDVARRLAQTRAVFDAWRRGEPLPDTVSAEDRAVWEGESAWFKSYLDHDPLTVVRQLKKVPVFVAQGELDRQVRVVDAELLEGAFRAAGNKRVTRKVYPGLNHLFARTTTGSIADYADPDARVDEGFLADTVAFLKKNL